MKKKVKIQRKEYTRFGFPNDLKNDVVAVIGSSMTSTGAVATGLSFEEKKKWMPQILQVEEKDVKFRAEVDKWFTNLYINVPFEGVILDISTDPDGEPEVLVDYVKYKYCLAYPECSPTKEDGDKNDRVRFYIEDAEFELSQKTNKFQKTKLAMLELVKVTDSIVKTDWVLRALSIKYPAITGSITSISKLNKDQKDLKLKEVMDKDPDFFKSICTDEHLEFKAEIESLVSSGIMQKIGNRYINGSDDLGDMDATIAYLKNPNNSETYMILKAKLTELGISLRREEKQVEIKTTKFKKAE